MTSLPPDYEPDAVDRLADIVEQVIKALVDHENKVLITVVAERLHTNLCVAVHPRDFGKVVGRGGNNVSALRALVAAIGNKLKLPACTLLIEDPNPSRRGSKRTG